jgi:plasmid stability protein
MADVTVPLSIRLPSDLRTQLDIRAASNNTSLNAEIVDALRKSMKALPNYIVIRRCTSRMGVYYAAAWEESGDDFYSGEFGQDEKTALAAVEAEIKKRGFKLRDITIEHRSETLDRLTDDARSNAG